MPWWLDGGISEHQSLKLLWGHSCSLCSSILWTTTLNERGGLFVSFLPSSDLPPESSFFSIAMILLREITAK